jgi:four helix bundle protein
MRETGSSGGEVKNEIVSRMKALALETIRLINALPANQIGAVLGKQLLRAATAVGANYRSACKAKSGPDFIAKIAIAEEEADETQYWLELLFESGMIAEGDFRRLHAEARELTAILASSGKTAKANLALSRGKGERVPGVR